MSKSTRAQRGQARTNRPQRDQVEMQFLSLDQWLDKDHRVRILWQYVQSLDLSELYQEIKAVDGKVGRNAIDPQILFALWLFATLEGISSARRLEELTKRDIPYMWICGGVSVNYHKLADFRVANGDLLEQLLVDSIGVLLHQNLISLETVVQDGMRVRANAGAASFRREQSLEEALQEAAEHVQQVKQRHQDDPSGENRRQQAAQERAARQRHERLKRAKEELEKVKSDRVKKRRSTEDVRSSRTDPEARRSKMANGGFSPALNVQFATDGGSRMIVAVDVLSQGSDMGQMAPMHDKVKTTYQKTPANYLVDGAYPTIADVTSLEAQGTEVYGPLYGEKKQLEAGQDPYARKARDTDSMAAFRARMGTEQAKCLYRQRPSIAEFPNADCRNRGLHQFRVRGLVKAKAQTMWHVLTFNFLRMLNLGYLEVVMRA